MKTKIFVLTPVLLSTFGLCAQQAWCADKPGAPAVPNASSAIRLNFARADAGIVLATLGTRAHTNIIYSASKPREISIRISVPSLEEALRSVAATAGLEYRQVGRSYVVAAPEDLRQALKPFATSAYLVPTESSPAELTKLVEASLPYLTVRVVGKRLLVSGAESDIAQAQALVATPLKASEAPALASAVMPVQNVSATQVALVLKSMYPGLQAEAVGTAEKVGGPSASAAVPRKLQARNPPYRRWMCLPARKRPGVKFASIRYGSAAPPPCARFWQTPRPKWGLSSDRKHTRPLSRIFARSPALPQVLHREPGAAVAAAVGSAAAEILLPRQARIALCRTRAKRGSGPNPWC